MVCDGLRDNHGHRVVLAVRYMVRYGVRVYPCYRSMGADGFMGRDGVRGYPR